MVADHSSKLLNDGSEEKIQPLKKFTSLKNTVKDIASFSYQNQSSVLVEAGLASVMGILPPLKEGLLYL